MAEQTVELAPGESRAITFEAIPHEAKTYQVSVNGLTGSFVAAPPESRIGSFTLYATNFNPLATRWRTIYRDETHQDNRYLYTWRSLSSSFDIIDINLENCEIRVSQRKDGLIGAVWYGPFSGIKDGGIYTLDLITGELTEGQLV